ncbi:MAG: tetratricopeptide repeat protein [Alphaproteobacteria bacterium]|nr:tetratricopeptide repeat protein [Alphaproteobacteria bacterium]MDD9920527.1 tetratricopeptide repeat protein [Alphaproteobacteria bacterium]
MVAPADAQKIKSLLQQGQILAAQKNWAQATKVYTQIDKLLPKNADVLNMLGSTYFYQKEYTKAAQYYRKGLTCSPNHQPILNNLGNSLFSLGDADALVSLLTTRQNLSAEQQLLLAQAHWVLQQTDKTLAQLEAILTTEELTELTRAKTTIMQALLQYAAFPDIQTVQKTLQPLAETYKTFPAPDGVWIGGYYRFLSKLCALPIPTSPTNSLPMYAIGDSHTLSYAHHSIELNGQSYTIQPRILFNAMAFHFSAERPSPAKTAMRTLAKQLPKNTPLLFSVGEIDCRQTAGILPYLLKNPDKKAEDIVAQTVAAYISFIAQAFNKHEAPVFIHGVPAPLAENQKLENDQWQTLLQIIALFNESLQKEAEKHGFTFVDIYKKTVNNQMVAQENMHLDTSHIHPDIAVSCLKDTIT